MAKRQPRLLILQVRLIIVLSLFANTVMTPPENSCPEGTFTFYSKGRVTCVPCPEGTYNPWKHNGKTNCFPCTKIRDPVVEISVSECNGIYDADIRCKDDFFRYLDQHHLGGPKCMNCTPCQDGYVQPRPCESFRDTVCCWDTNGNQIYDDKDAEKCSGMMRLIKCHRGKYYDKASNECRPCPNNTFMSEDDHSKPKCKPCDSAKTTDLPENFILKQGCTSTRPPEYGCKAGFYGKSIHRYSPENFRCYPCQKCPAGMHAGRSCDMYHDTVCCDEPNMVVVDFPEGGMCIKQKMMEIHPAVSYGIRLQEGDCQSVQCSLALPNWPADITWTLPNANRKLDSSWSTHQTINKNIITTTSIITICNVTPEDEGELICQADVEGNRWIAITTIGPACKSGTYNPPNCDRNCSNNCKASGGSDLDLLLCDDISGACVSGCVDGYTGDLCTASDTKEKVKESEENEHVLIALSVTGFLLSLILGIILGCIAYMKRYPESGPKWCHKLVNLMAPEPQKTKDVRLPLMSKGSESQQINEEEKAEIKRIKEENKHEMDRVRKENIAEIKRINNEKEAEIERIKEENKHKIDKANEENIAEIKRINTNKESETEKLKKENEHEMERIKEKNRSEFERMNGEKETEIGRVKEENRREMTRVKEENRAEIERMNKEMETEIERVKEENRREMKRVERENIIKVKSIEQKYMLEIKRVEEKFRAEIKESRNELEKLKEEYILVKFGKKEEGLYRERFTGVGGHALDRPSNANNKVVPEIESTYKEKLGVNVERRKQEASKDTEYCGIQGLNLHSSKIVEKKGLVEDLQSVWKEGVKTAAGFQALAGNEDIGINTDYPPVEEPKDKGQQDASPVVKN